MERRENIKALLHDLNFSFFDAECIDEHHWIHSFYNKSKTKKFKGYELTTPELGCFASHISLWKKCSDSNESILILEDNIILDSNLPKQLNNIKNLTNQFGLIKLSNIYSRKYVSNKTIDETFQLISNLKGACGTSAYAISPETARLYLNKVNDFFEPVDDFMDNEWRTRQTIYSYHPELIYRNKIKSTIGHRKIKFKISIINKLHIEFYRVYKQLMQSIYNKRFKL